MRRFTFDTYLIWKCACKFRPLKLPSFDNALYVPSLSLVIYVPNSLRQIRRSCLEFFKIADTHEGFGTEFAEAVVREVLSFLDTSNRGKAKSTLRDLTAVSGESSSCAYAMPYKYPSTIIVPEPSDVPS